MYDIESRWEELESDLAEADRLIKSLTHSGRYADKQVEAVDSVDRMRSASQFPLPVVNAYVYGGESILHAWRKYRGMTHEELAERSGIPRSDLFRLERTGVISAVDAKRLAAVLGIYYIQLMIKR